LLCHAMCLVMCSFFFQAEDGIRDRNVTGVQTCALPISSSCSPRYSSDWVMMYSRSTSSRSGGSMITAPAIPAAMCAVIGAVPQWYIQIPARFAVRSEEHTSELQSRFDLVCRLLLEKTK